MIRFEQVGTKDTFANPLFIKRVYCPGCPAEGGCEFCPDKKCYSTRITRLDLETNVMEKLTFEGARKAYKDVYGRQDRINFWLALREMKGG